MNKKVAGTLFGLSVMFGGMIGVLAVTDTPVPTLMQVVPVSATIGDVDPSGSSSSCVELTNNLRYRMRDTGSSSDVNSLQDFLITANLMQGESTGYFGAGTLKAVKLFQSKVRLTQSGYVGELTRAKIKELSCPGPVPNMMEVKRATGQGMQPGDAIGRGTTTEAKKLPLQAAELPGIIFCTMEARMCPDGTMMPRDASCGWHPEKCGTQKDVSTIAPLSACMSATMEIRTCPNGAVMPRDASCNWLPEKCSTSAISTQDLRLRQIDQSIIEVISLLRNGNLTAEQKQLAEQKLATLQKEKQAISSQVVPLFPNEPVIEKVPQSGMMVGSTSIMKSIPSSEPMPYPYPPKQMPLETW